MNNGPQDNANTLSEKWEALALVPALDPATPNDWFLFVGNDNDFITTNGLQDGTSYAAAFDNDTMVLVYRLSLPSRITNVSSRALTGTGASTHIAGFVVSGAKPKQLLIRGVGPTLAGFSVTGSLADPTLAIFNGAGQHVYANDDWGSAANLAELRAATTAVGAFVLSDASKDSALLVTLDPGAYSAQVNGVAGATGVSLLEVYEVP